VRDLEKIRQDESTHRQVFIMSRKHSVSTCALIGACSSPPARVSSAQASFSPVNWFGLARRILGFVVLVGLVEMWMESAEPELQPQPDAEIWVARAADYAAVDSVLFAPDGKTIASVSSNAHAILWDVVTGQRSEAQPEGADRIRSVAFSPDGRTLAGGSLDGTVILWDMKSLEVRSKIRAHTSAIKALAFSPYGEMLASGSTDGTLILWRATAAGYSWIHQLRTSASVVSIAFSPDGASLATSHGNGEVRIRDVVAPRYSSIVVRFSSDPCGLAFSPDGSTLATSGRSSSSILLWDLPARRERANLVGPAKGVQTLAFSPDGRNLIVAGSDGALQLKDLIAGRDYSIAQGNRDRIWSVAFSPDGRSLATAGNDHCVRLWDVAKLTLARNDQAVPQLRLERGHRPLN
jgi:WD40 repeat protein